MRFTTGLESVAELEVLKDKDPQNRLLQDGNALAGLDPKMKMLPDQP